MGKRTTKTSGVPTGIPILARGWHGEPALGSCFMEYASVLAGEEFTDHPRCTHPVLATLCRAVNDAMSDGGRQRLAPFVPDVIGTRSHDPAVTAALVLTAADAARAVRKPDAIVMRGRREALRRLHACRRGRMARAMLVATEVKASMHASATIRRCVTIVAAAGDDHLVSLLRDAIGCVPRQPSSGVHDSAHLEGACESGGAVHIA